RKPLAGLSVAEHRFTARALYGSNPTSAAWTLSIVNYPPLTIDTSLMTFSGTLYQVPASLLWQNKGFRLTQQRTAQGGVPPYTYTSSNPAIAPVAIDGTVTGLRAGTVTITVKDSAANTASYTVQSTIVNYEILHNPHYMYGAASVNWVNSVGGTTVNTIANFSRDIDLQYFPPSGQRRGIWIGVFTREVGGKFGYYFFYPLLWQFQEADGNIYDLATICAKRT
ncbi:MAG: Ig-like domain-containing protein, partial [Pseudomonas proteolytica]|uniref:Ig-like domain-containing protein n=1 Tax=Pseudomonas proteolytica TaxID=219574 RepID=UPI003F3B390A